MLKKIKEAQNSSLGLFTDKLNRSTLKDRMDLLANVSIYFCAYQINTFSWMNVCPQFRYMLVSVFFMPPLKKGANCFATVSRSVGRYVGL